MSIKIRLLLTPESEDFFFEPAILRVGLTCGDVRPLGLESEADLVKGSIGTIAFLSGDALNTIRLLELLDIVGIVGISNALWLKGEGNEPEDGTDMLLAMFPPPFNAPSSVIITGVTPCRRGFALGGGAADTTAGSTILELFSAALYGDGFRGGCAIFNASNCSCKLLSNSLNDDDRNAH